MSLKSKYYENMINKYNTLVEETTINQNNIYNLQNKIRNKINEEISNSKLLKKYLYINSDYYYDNSHEYLDNLLNQIFIPNSEFEGIEWKVVNMTNNYIIQLKMF